VRNSRFDANPIYSSELYFSNDGGERDMLSDYLAGNVKHHWPAIRNKLGYYYYYL
jgi:hypothetical protein